MKNILFVIFVCFGLLNYAQELKTNDAYISFFSEKEAIEAENSEVEESLNITTGEIKISVAINKFIFPNSTMQKHFNDEGVMNSIEFPTANFIGYISNNTDVDYTADGEYNVIVQGKMTIKGVSKDISVKGNIVVANGVISTNSVFSLDRFEYGVDSKEKSVSQILKITVKANFK